MTRYGISATSRGFVVPSAVDALLGPLNGEMHVVIGNNGEPATVAWQGWASVGRSAEIKADRRELVLCHDVSRLGGANLHGHSTVDSKRWRTSMTSAWTFGISCR